MSRCAYDILWCRYIHGDQFDIMIGINTKFLESARSLETRQPCDTRVLLFYLQFSLLFYGKQSFLYRRNFYYVLLNCYCFGKRIIYFVSYWYLAVVLELALRFPKYSKNTLVPRLVIFCFAAFPVLNVSMGIIENYSL